ncbi:hypothetical protein HZU77_012435 [Neisseriaceae bacterium TC5R-5]|nr:hypothetical protein [Neisseriaceae bacterium TC5R-5]
MKLTLMLPGLAWLDDAEDAALEQGLQLMALQRLLACGRYQVHTCRLTELLSQPWGGHCTGLAKAWAQQAGLAAEQGAWLLADPVHLRIDRDRALLADVGVLSLSEQEAAQFTADLNQHFRDDGWCFHPLAAGRWLLQLQDAPAASFSPLPDVVGEDIHQHLPTGPRGLDWSRLLNELQMLLYTHAGNDAREARGELSVNSVWLWGEGEPPSNWPPARAKIFSDDGLMQSLAAYSGSMCEAAPHDFAAWLRSEPAADNYLLLDGLLAPAQYRDAWGWREALQALEHNWLQALLPALRHGQLSELTLLSHGPYGFSLTVRPSDLWKFWRRPRSLASLH